MSENFKKNMINSGGKRTICEVLREIYWATTDESIREKSIDAMHMAKRMDRKLRINNGKWDENEWKNIDNPEEIIKQRTLQYINEMK